MGRKSRGSSFERVGWAAMVAIGVGWFTSAALAQNAPPAPLPDDSSSPYRQTTEDYNRRLAELGRGLSSATAVASPANGGPDYRIGPDDQLDITVLEAAELDRAPRVSASGEISLALVGTVRAAGLTTRELETVIEELLRRSYIKEPHVSVQVRDMQSHPVAVFGAVKKPGVFQVRGPKTVVELLSLAEGLAADAGDTVIVEHRSEDSGALPATAADPAVPRGAAEIAPPGGSLAHPAADADSSHTVSIDLKRLLNTGDPRLNVLVYPGDVVKVPRAELVYVVGEVGKPGGFELKSNESISVLQAIALAQGLTHTSASSRSRIIRTNAVTGERREIPIDVSKVLAGKLTDPLLEPRDIVFVPNSTGRTALYRGVETVVSIGSGVAVYRW